MATEDKKVIKYLNLTHPEFVRSLQEWSKIFFPRESKNLNSKASSGRHFIEVSSFIGDVLAFYMEDRFRNSNLITANDPKESTSIGSTVSLDGDLALISAPADVDNAAYVFARSGGDWTQQTKLTVSEGESTRLGWTVSLDGSQSGHTGSI